MNNSNSRLEASNLDPLIRLGVNVDHVGTLRNARGGVHPDPVLAAHMAAEAGADLITIHLREDRRHILDSDISRLIHESNVPINMEMAATEEMASIAISNLPSAICLVPEQRQELTTEGGLDVAGQLPYLTKFIGGVSESGIKVTTFVDPDERQIEASLNAGANAVELHVGKYCESYDRGNASQNEFKRLVSASQYAISSGLECHAGHGLNYGSAAIIAKIGQITELNIGHFLIGESVFTGLRDVVTKMRNVIALARSS
mgnify:CR=1 FL=1|tara:strand:+ start:273 stop:1049 length:777 start_codon:yes stop_codon:yes gene_type:complete